MKQLRNQAQSVRSELQQMERAGMQDTDSYQEKVGDLKRLERAIQQNKAAYVDLNDVVNNLSKHSLAYLQKMLRETRRRMNALNPEEVAKRHGDYNKELAELAANYRIIDDRIGKLTGQWKRQDGAIRSVLERLGAYVGIYGAYNLATEKLTRVFTSNLEFSDQLADIRKTTGLSTQAVEELSQAIMDIDTRSSVQELHNLAYEAGRLGIGSQGVEGVLGFVRAADKLNVALKEDLGDDAIIQLTKMADVMGLTKTMGVEKSLLSIGSAINSLAQSSTASGDFLVDYSSRLSGIATQAHLTTAELLGFAAAADATGQEVEVSATAMNKFVVQLQSHYKTVAQAAGLDESDLHNLLTMGKTAEAVVMVLEALGAKGGLSVLAPLMKDMGSDGARLTASLATMASNIDLVKQQLDIANEAFEENISVTNEAAIRNENAAAIMAKMKNSWDKVFTNSANVGVVKDLAEDFRDLSNTLQNSHTLILALQAAVFAVVTALKLLLALTPTLIQFFAMKGIVTAILHLNKFTQSATLARIAMSLWEPRILSITALLGKLKTAWAAMNLTMKANVIGAAFAALMGLVSFLKSLKRELTDAEKEMNQFNESVKKFERNSHAAGVEANMLFERLKNAEKGSKEHEKLMGQINDQYGKYLPNLLNEKSSLEEIATAQETVNTKLRQALALKAKNQAIDEAGQTYTPKMAEAAGRMQEIYTKQGMESLGEDDVRHMIAETQRGYDAGLNQNSLYRSVLNSLYRSQPGSGKKGRSFDLVNGGDLSLFKKDLELAVQNYVANFWNQNVAVKRAAKKYDPLIDGYTEKVESGAPYTIIEAEDDSEKRKKLKAARDEHKAIMAAIEIFYKQQEQVVNDAYLKKEMTITQREQALADIEDRFRRSRIAADEALLDRPGAHSAWSAELQRMEQENISQTEDTTQALDNLWGKNLKQIGDRLRKFGDGEMDGIWKNLETDRTKIQESAIKLAQEVEAILTQYDFEAQVTEKFIGALQKLNIFFPALTDNMKEGSERAMADLQAIYPKLFSIDINTDEGLKSFRNLLMEAEGLSKETLNLSAENLQLLYYKTLEYGDAMVEAQKKARDRGVKVGTAAYQRTGQYQSNKTRISTEEQGVEVYKAAEQLGLASDIMVQDQEVKLYEARLKAAQDYYEYLQSTGRDTKEAEIQLQEATAELAAALVEKTKEQFDVLRSYGGNLEDFGADFGEAIFGGIEDRQDALEDFVRAVGKTTQELLMNWVKQKIEHAILRKAMIKTEQRSQKEMTGAVEEGQQMETTIVQAGQEAISQAVVDMGTKAVTAKKQQAAENVSTEAAETSANATMGIASGAAKTIGELGWWGIPLVAVITALINGLLNMAMSKVGSLFGGSNAAAGATAPTKLVTGMLTYAGGNVQRVLGNDGQIYDAKMGGVNGSGLVKMPTLTKVGGEAALVGEQGPEIVIGRATTKALMQDNSGLLEGLVAFDRLHSGRGFRTYAGGNVQMLGENGELLTPEQAEAVLTERVMSAVNTALAPTLKGMTRAMAENASSNRALLERLAYPISATVERRHLVNEVASGLEQEKRRGSNDSVRRLFGTTRKG